MVARPSDEFVWCNPGSLLEHDMVVDSRREFWNLLEPRPSCESVDWSLENLLAPRHISELAPRALAFNRTSTQL